MAVSAVTHLTAKGGAKPVTTAAITPTAGSLLLAAVVHSSDVDMSSAITGTLGGIWTRVTRIYGSLGTTLSLELLYCSDFGTTGTLIVNHNTGSFVQVSVAEVVGAKNAGPVKQFKSGQLGAGNSSLTLTYDTAPTNACYGAFLRDSGAAVTPGAGYSTLNDNVDAWALAPEYRLTPSTTCSLSQAGNAGWNAIAIEFDVVAAGRSAGFGPVKMGWRR